MNWEKPTRKRETGRTGLQAEVMTYAIQRGWTADKVVSQSRRGFFDCIFVRRGVVLFAELKRDDDEEPKAQQQLRHQQFRDHGANVVVIDSMEKAIEYLR